MISKTIKEVKITPTDIAELVAAKFEVQIDGGEITSIGLTINNTTFGCNAEFILNFVAVDEKK